MDTEFFLGALAGTQGPPGPPIPFTGQSQIEPGWQTLAVPMKTGYWDAGTHAFVEDLGTRATIRNCILDQLDDIYGPGQIEVITFRSGDETVWRSYRPGVTPDGSPDNAYLMPEDPPGSFEYDVLGLLVKSAAAGPLILKWGVE